MERKLTEVKMPESGLTVSIVERMTYGETKQVKEVMANGAIQRVVEGKVEFNFNGGLNQQIVDKVVGFFVVKIVDKNGKELPVSMETLDQELTEADGEILESAIAERIEFIKKKLK